MTQETYSKYLPHLVVLTTLLVIEYWTLMTHAANLPIAGDYGPLIGIPLILSIVLVIIIALGLHSICNNTESYKKVVTISLILLIIQMILIFVEYTIIAFDSGS